uniref:Uncharacterized protein n=1 Tax=Biomphalaria glabrata TaxID=6526 RepID=A0A2C9LFL8_BIOGL
MAMRCRGTQNRSNSRNNYNRSSSTHNYNRTDSRNNYRADSRNRYSNYNNNYNNNTYNRSKSREYKNRDSDRVFFVRENKNNFAFYPAFINNVPIKAIRDSGCNTLVVRADLIEAQYYRGYTRKVELADGSIKEFKVFKVFIETPFYTGHCEGVAMPNMRHDMLIGNLTGLKECSRQEIEAWEKKYERLQQNRNTETENYISNMVITRSKNKPKQETQEFIDVNDEIVNGEEDKEKEVEIQGQKQDETQAEKPERWN